MNHSEIFLVAMLIILTVPYLIWRVFKTEYFAPLVVVQIIIGIVLGPGALGAIFPDYYAFVFNPSVIDSLNGLAWWAVMLFVWIAGLELDLKSAWKYRLDCGVTALATLTAPVIFGCIAAAIMLTVPGWQGAKAMPWQFVMGIGMSCAVTALPILILFLEKLNILRTPLGQRILRYASLEDLAIWGILALILLDWNRMGMQVAFVLGFAICSLAIRRLMAGLQSSDRWFVGLIWLAACALGADWSGLHFMVGAFLAGAVLDADWFGQAETDMLRHNILLVAMPVFFLSTGLKTKWEMGGSAVFLVAALLLSASIGGKLIGTHIAGRILKWPKGDSRIIGWLLQTKALIMIIFANILLDKQIISNESFTALLLMAVGSTMLTIPIVKPMLKRLS